MRKVFFGVVSVGFVGAWSIVGCNTPGGVDLGAPALDGGDGAAIEPRGVGDRCDDGGVCRPGLACTEGVCQPGRSLDEGTACVISAECKDGLYCGPTNTCAPAGTGGDGDACSSDADCRSALRCNLVGLSPVCQPEGTGDVGDPCATSAACFGGLFCAENQCVKLPPGSPPFGLPSFQGVACAEESGPVTAHFRVPRGTDDDGDYFRLPFPNDIRTASGRPNLAGFPTPGAGVLGFDVVDRWARHLEKTADGFSAYPTVTFRFSGEIDFDSLNADGAADFIDLDTGNASFGYTWSATSGRTQYVCANSLSYRPRTGEPLEPGHRYAVILTNKVLAKDKTPVAPSADFTAMLGASSPGGELAAAYQAYAPLRAWAASRGFNLATLVNAAVFKVGDHGAIVRKLAAAVSAATPSASGWVRCGGGAASPCAQADGDRACPATADAAFDELHALVSLPRFQKGNAPFLEPGDGGDVDVDGSGDPIQQGTTSVCLSLTVPKGTMPGGGWPLVVYGHGTGGSFRSHVTEGLAARLAAVDGTTQLAVLGIDQVGHGTRRGSSTEKPEALFFNFTNPAAARGNVLQGAVDQASLVRFAKSLTLDAGSSPTGAEIRFGNVAFWGHSQGATEGSVIMPYTAGVEGVLFSGLGASLIDSLLTKKSPVNLAAVAPVLISELPANINAYHPVLGLLQNAIDPADALNHAAPLTAATGELAKHVFMVYGQGDTYSTPATQLTYLVAAKLGAITPPASASPPDDLLVSVSAPPLGGNLAGNTAVVRQYKPSAYDGHFVVFRDADAKTNADRFLADALAGGAAPQVGR